MSAKAFHWKAMDDLKELLYKTLHFPWKTSLSVVCPSWSVTVLR